MAFIVTTQPGPPEAPDVDIAIVATDDAELSWPHVEYDIYGNPVNVTKYLIYRETRHTSVPLLSIWSRP